MDTSLPAQRLKEGANILLVFLAPRGFSFEFRGDGRGCGGHFAWGEFTKSDRRLEVHFRQGLGQVAYHAGTASASHEAYMGQLGVSQRCRYPGFPLEPMQAFHDLAHDLAFAEEFLSGDASVLLAAARAEKVSRDSTSEVLMAGYTGQNRELEKMREDFKAGRYREVIAAYEKLPLPHLLTDAQLKLVELARARDA